MYKTGQILSIVPTRGAGGYQHIEHGWICTYDMTIQCEDGQVVGEISSKSSPYPMSAGEQISVQLTNSAHGVKFKKFNPQYAPQQGQQQAPQGQQQAPQQARQPSNASNSGGGKDARGMVRHGVVCAYIQSGSEPTIDQVEPWVEYIMTGKQQQIPMEQFVDENPEQADGGDDIPF